MLIYFPFTYWIVMNHFLSQQQSISLFWTCLLSSYEALYDDEDDHDHDHDHDHENEGWWWFHADSIFWKEQGIKHFISLYLVQYCTTFKACNTLSITKFSCFSYLSQAKKPAEWYRNNICGGLGSSISCRKLQIGTSHVLYSPMRSNQQKLCAYQRIGCNHFLELLFA